jgi:deazaflavin-dependent oxidoreductase (nitroreductase family)
MNRLIRFLNKLANPALKLILRSPLHSLVSDSVMLITYTGRRSGKTYTTPVNYVRDGDALLVVSTADRTWWRNLRGGAPVIVHLAGKELYGHAESAEDPQAVAEGMLALLRRLPALHKRYKVALTPEGLPERPEQLARATQGKVIIRVTELAYAALPQV